MWGFVCFATVLLAVIGWVVSRGSVYRRIFSDEHMTEVARGLARLKVAAFASPVEGEPPLRRGQDDPRTLISSAGLVFVYTIRLVDGRFAHHWSVSLRGGYTAHAVGEAFILLAAKVMGVPPERLGLFIGRSTVHHAEFELSGTEHDAFRAQPVVEMSAADLRLFRAERIEVGDRLQWAREPG